MPSMIHRLDFERPIYDLESRIESQAKTIAKLQGELDNAKKKLQEGKAA